MEAGILVSLVGLVVVVLVHITMIARWSGKVDTLQEANIDQHATTLNLVEQKLQASTAVLSGRLLALDQELMRLRDARHQQDGHIARIDGAVRTIQIQLGGRLSGLEGK